MENQGMNEITPNSTQVQLLGEFLRQKRIEKNFTLEKLSQKTKISVNILKALEANDYEHLPSAAYIKGFVTSYVKVLGMPLEDAIIKMESTYLTVVGKTFPALNHTRLMTSQTTLNSKLSSPESVESPHEVIESGDSIIESTKSFLPVFIFGAIILTFIGGYKLISSVVENEVSDQKTKDLGPKIEPSSALVNPSKSQPTPVQGTAEKTGTLNNSNLSTLTEATEASNPEGPEPVVEIQRNFPNVEFKKVKGQLFSIKSEAPENQDDSLLPKLVKDSMNSDLQNIYIKATEGNTWLSYKIDNSPIESVIINKGSDLLLQGSEIRIFLGNVNVTRIFYNNSLIETPTKNGVKSLIFPESSNAKFQLPLFPKAKDDILYTAEDYIKRMKLEQEELENKKTVQ
jgi:cytoskeleton protein RodZ